jgi:hypothetical protein
MRKLISFFIFLLLTTHAFSQIPVDLKRSVPLWLDYDTVSTQANLKWIGDNNANSYIINKIEFDPIQLTPIETLKSTSTEYDLGELIPGEEYSYLIRKNDYGEGIITLGIELPAIHERGRCLLAIDDTLGIPLKTEIAQLMKDLEMDGWEVDTLLIPRSTNAVTLKAKVINWYDSVYDNSQTLFILGHIAVPYSGNKAHDGHSIHKGAWPADVFYGELNGIWTDETVNDTSAEREVYRNIPGDGKYDQTLIPTSVEIEVGRVDFYDLPAFSDNEIELTRRYLNKNHAFRTGELNYPRRGLVENNFTSYSEGFGQSGWRNFTTMFGGDSVSIQDFETVLENEKYLCSYACGPGSYVSVVGLGTTQDLWAVKDIKTVFTLNFGSGFGDWDNQNNFLRAALASGDVLTNAWAGRPVWQMFQMALGKHIGYCTRFTQNLTGAIIYQGESSNSTHIALMGDPTLRLHALKKASNLTLSFADGNISLNWESSSDATHGYFIYRKTNDAEWELIDKLYSLNSYTDKCVTSNTKYEYMIKAIRLEHTGSGSYFNTSLGTFASIQIEENPFIRSFFADKDMDGFGDENSEIQWCDSSPGYVDNNLDCDDTNAEINPNAIEIELNGIDENCDGIDILLGLNEINEFNIKVFPNPATNYIIVENNQMDELDFRLFNTKGQVLQSGKVTRSIDLPSKMHGLYWLEITIPLSKEKLLTKIIVN